MPPPQRLWALKVLPTPLTVDVVDHTGRVGEGGVPILAGGLRRAPPAVEVVALVVELDRRREVLCCSAVVGGHKAGPATPQCTRQ